jgi:hypothetical protein
MQTEISNEIYKTFINNEIDAVVMPGFAFPSAKLGRISVIYILF